MPLLVSQTRTKRRVHAAAPPSASKRRAANAEACATCSAPEHRRHAPAGTRANRRAGEVLTREETSARGKLDAVRGGDTPRDEASNDQIGGVSRGWQQSWPGCGRRGYVSAVRGRSSASARRLGGDAARLLTQLQAARALGIVDGGVESNLGVVGVGSSSGGGSGIVEGTPSRRAWTASKAARAPSALGSLAARRKALAMSVPAALRGLDFDARAATNRVMLRLH